MCERVYVYMYVGVCVGGGGVWEGGREGVMCVLIITDTMSVELYKQDYNVPLHYDVIMTS